MTDQEPKSNAPSASGSSVVLVEKSRHKTFRSTELKDQSPAEPHHKRAHAPAVPSVAEEYKDMRPENEGIKEQKESELVSSEKTKRRTSKKSSKRSTSPEPIAMLPIEVVQRTDIINPSVKLAIPSPKTSDISDSKEMIDNDDSITEEITDLRTAESTHKEWAEEEAGGLPRAESRASRMSRSSRVSRVWRQLFCCGVPYEAPSEHHAASPRGGEFASGI